jgi:hypothetical protein
MEIYIVRVYRRSGQDHRQIAGQVDLLIDNHGMQ